MVGSGGGESGECGAGESAQFCCGGRTHTNFLHYQDIFFFCRNSQLEIIIKATLELLKEQLVQSVIISIN